MHFYTDMSGIFDKMVARGHFWPAECFNRIAECSIRVYCS